MALERSVTGQIRALLLATCISAAMAASAVQAQNSKDTWNMYEPYKVSTFLPFATPISIANAPTLDVQVGSMTVSRQAIVDTGSIGLQISRDLWNPIGQTPIGAGSIFLSSSNVTNSGNFYNTTVQFTDFERQARDLDRAGAGRHAVVQGRRLQGTNSACVHGRRPQPLER